MKRRRNNSISGQFSARLIEMLNSPAYRVLSRAAHMVLARIEIEHANHGGNDNGCLPVTFDDFEDYGIERHAISPAINEAEALGFTEVTERGHHGMANRRRPNLFRLTYRPLPTDRKGDGSHEWRRIATTEHAKAVAKEARKKSVSLVRNSSRNSGETPLKQAKNRGKTPLPDRGETPLLSISRVSNTAEQACSLRRPAMGALRRPASSSTDRDDLIQARVAQRLGGGAAGWSVLLAIPDDILGDLIEAERAGALTDDVILILRQKFLQRGAA